MARPPTWVVVGGCDRGGVIVRTGLDLGSPKAEERLSYGALVEELELVGERLHFRRLLGSGPERGWLSIRLPDKELVVRAMPQGPAQPATGHIGAGAPGTAAAGQAAVTFYAISDVHVELQQNMAWLEDLPRFERSVVLVAGDLAVNLAQARAALRLFQEKFGRVFYCYGNHETWMAGTADEGVQDSFQKLDALRQLCQELGVFTTPQLVEGVWVVPVLGWYHTSWDTEPDLQPPEGKQLARRPLPGEKFASDSHACRWGGLKNGSEELAQALDEQNELWGAWPLPEELLENLRLPRGERRHPVVSFSHFLPRLELMPEKRFLFQPNLTQIVGSKYIHDRVAKLQPDVHVFGHSHFPWDMTLEDGVRYRSWPLGTPAEQARRIASYPTEHTEQWHPLPVFDSEGRHHPGDEACWFSLMYTRIRREPQSCHMAEYVAATYCPGAPVVPATVISPGLDLEPTDEAARERRGRYMGRSASSVRAQVSSWKAAAAEA